MPSRDAPTEVVIRIDGGSRGNPGPAAFAVVVEDARGTPQAAFSKFLGQATNNVAEYQALLAALEYALQKQYSRVRILSDSELLVRQIKGTYKVKSQDLKPLHQRACGMVERFRAFSIRHVPRAENRGADRLVNEALDQASRGVGRMAAAVSAPLRASAKYVGGVLKPDHELPLAEGEAVELEIRRKK